MPRKIPLRPDPKLWEKLKPLTEENRRRPTEAESRLWEHLRGRKLDGAKFRRQHAIGKFIVDFYCEQYHLIVEVDGPIHDLQREDDAFRQEYLESLGLRVCRVTNDQVMNHLDQVLGAIRQACGI